MVATFFKPAVLYKYRAANGPWTKSVVQVRKYVLYGRFGLLAGSAPLVRVGLVLAGETWTMLAAPSTGWTDRDTEEFNVPTTPTTWSSPASLVAAFFPTSGVAWSSWASSSNFQPGTAFWSFACLTARSTEFLIPSPRADRSPESGAITPILATLVEVPLLLPPDEVLLRVPQAEKASVAASSGPPAATSRCVRTDVPPVELIVSPSCTAKF